MEINELEQLDNIPQGSFGVDFTKTSRQLWDIKEEEDLGLSSCISVFPNKRIGEHGNVYEGEVRSSVYGVRPCVIKFAELSEQNIREAEILTKLGSHTNVIAIIQSGTYSGALDERVYIALDKCHNENLRQYIANRKAAGIEFDLNQAIDFAKQIIVGVIYIHDNNVIHLDLKPSNILISQNLHLIKIADFGLSIVVKSPKSKIIHKRQFGTNGYRPIESFGNGEVSQRTDIFSLGTVLLHLLSNGNDVFGRDEHAFIHNVMNDITDTSGLLVHNPKTTEHLIKCMVNKERCRRPNIREVSDHPSWSGREVDCQFGYFADDEIDDDGYDDDTQIIRKKEMMSSTDIEREKQFLQKMKEMGFNRKPTIVVFDHESERLYRFDHTRNSMTKMHRFPDGVHLRHFRYSAISFGEYIYIFLHDGSVFRLEYGDVPSTWTRMSDWILNHGPRVPIAASSTAIFLVGSGLRLPRKSVTVYIPSLDKWERAKNKITATINSTLLCCKEYLYCFGGVDETWESTNQVERMNLTTREWDQLRSMNQRRRDSSASEFDGKLFVIGGYENSLNRLNSCEMYNPELDQWTNMKSMLVQRHYFRSFWISQNLFAVGGNSRPNSIETYDPAKDEWVPVTYFVDMDFRESVLVTMTF